MPRNADVSLTPRLVLAERRSHFCGEVLIDYNILSSGRSIGQKRDSLYPPDKHGPALQSQMHVPRKFSP
jgi:hypothetical protein